MNEQHKVPEGAHPLDSIVLNDPHVGQIINKKHIQAVDRNYWSPQERALGVHNLFENHLLQLRKEEKNADLPTRWDILCYCIEYLGMEAVGLEDPDLLSIARNAAEWLYSTHYTYYHKIYGAPDKKREKELKYGLQHIKESVREGEGSPRQDAGGVQDIPDSGTQVTEASVPDQGVDGSIAGS